MYKPNTVTNSLDKAVFLLLSATLFLSCNSGEKNQNDFKENDNLNLEAKIKIEVFDSLYQGVSNQKSTHLEADSLYFITLNGMQKKLEIVNLTSKKVNAILNLSENEDFIKNQLGTDTYYVHSLDSIFLLSILNNRMALIDHQGNLKETWNLTAAIEDFQSEDFMALEFLDATMFYNARDNQAMFRTKPPSEVGNPAYYTKDFLSVYDFGTESFTRSFGDYPEAYQNKNDFFVNSYEISIVPFFEKDKYYTSFVADHNIYVASLSEDEIMDTIDGKSNYLEEFELIPRTSDSQTKMNHMTESGRYKKMLYNRYNGEFYRVVVHDQDLKDPVSGKVNNGVFNRSFSVIVFNENFEKEGEFMFEKPTFTFFDITTHPEGFMINSKGDTDENLNVFEVYSI